MNLFAAASGIDLPASSKVPGLVASDLILIIGLGTLIFGGIITWAVFIRGPREHPSRKRSSSVSKTPVVTVTEDGRERHRKKKRVRRRDHRQRNPTLSQTGGLPPPRPAEETPAV